MTDMESKNHTSQTQGHQNFTAIDMHHSPMPQAIRDKIPNFDNLRANLMRKLKLDNKWFVLASQQTLHIFNLNKKMNGNLSIRNTVRIDANLVVKVFGEIGDKVLFTEKLYWWHQLQKLLEQLINVKCERDFDFVCVQEEQPTAEDDGVVDRPEEGRTFEFCGTNVKAGSSKDCLNTPNDDIDSFLKVEMIISECESRKSPELESNTLNEDSHICLECGEEFDEDAQLIIHKKVHESQICPVCSESVTGKMDRHMELHLNGNSYQCRVCGRKYQSVPPLQRHMQFEHFTPIDEFFCDICKDGRVFATKLSIQAHMKAKHHNQKRKEKELSQLEWVLTQEERIQKKNVKVADDSSCINSKHQASGKRKSRNHVCHICGVTCYDLERLKAHITVKHSDEGHFTCDFCQNGKVYRLKAYLRKHLASVHCKGAKPLSVVKRVFKCNICNEELPSQYTLKSHTFFKHNIRNGTEYQCKVCYKTFAMKKSLEIHEKLHFVGTHICRECGKSFNHPHYLRKHINKIHKEIKKKECTMCEKQYANKLDLRLHMKKIHNVMLPVKTTQGNARYTKYVNGEMVQ